PQSPEAAGGPAECEGLAEAGRGTGSGRLALAVRRWKAADQSYRRPRPGAGHHAGGPGHEPCTETGRLQLRWSYHLLRIHAGDRDGYGPYSGLLPVSGTGRQDRCRPATTMNENEGSDTGASPDRADGRPPPAR